MPVSSDFTLPIPPDYRPVSVAQMQAIDRKAIENLALPRLLLMDHAGLAVARQTAVLIGDNPRPVFVGCGSGYNGGDGLSAARHLAGWGYSVRVVLFGSVKSLREEPGLLAKHLLRLKIPIEEVSSLEDVNRIVPALLRGCSVFVDALLGVGVCGAVREPLRCWIEAVNRSQKPVVAVDLPSGLDGDSGKIADVAIEATLTVTLGRIKQGCLSGQGPRRAGKLMLDEATFPRALLRSTS